MKTSILSGLLCASLLVFSAGCGKDKDKGGGVASPVYGNFNPITGGNINLAQIDPIAVNSYNLLVDWRNRIQNNPAQEARLLGNGIGYSRGVLPVSPSTQPSLPAGCNPITISGFIIGYTCNGFGSGQQSPTSSVVPTSVIEKRCLNSVVNPANGVRQLYYRTALPTSVITSYSCPVNGPEVAYDISSNTELNQILSFEKGKIFRIQGSGGVFNIEVGHHSSGYQATHMYVIDTTIHSVYNPVASKLINSSEITKIYEAF